MTNEEILSKVKSNFGGYESISLANDDVERLLIIIRYIQKQSDFLTLGLLQEKNKVQKLIDALQYIIDNMDCPAVQCEGEWQTGMFCGLEDRGIVDRYDACMYGYNHAIERINEWVLCGIGEALQKPLGQEMADAFDKIIEPTENDIKNNGTAYN